MFQAKRPIQSRQNLAESTALPFAIFLDKGTRSDRPVLVATVGNKAAGWAGPTSQFRLALKTGQWYSTTLVYDMDTAALFVDDAIVTVHAFPDGRLNAGRGQDLFLGTWVDGRRHHFNGKLALFQWYSGIPEDVESRLDERRSHPEWFIYMRTSSAGLRWEGRRRPCHLTGTWVHTSKPINVAASCITTAWTRPLKYTERFMPNISACAGVHPSATS